MARKKHEYTSSRVGIIAGRMLGDPKTPKDVKSIAGSDLTQMRPRAKPKKPKR